MFLHFTLDDTSILYSCFYCRFYIQSISSFTTSIIIPNGACSDNQYKVFDFSRFTLVESIEIGNNCFDSVKTFEINGLNQLQSLIIGNNSFNKLATSFLSNPHSTSEWMKKSDRSKSFHILNCESLESIQIGEYSFSDFAGDFELKNLPQLQSIHIGIIGSYSRNFRFSSFVIRGIELILNIWMIRSSKSTIHYIRWLCIRLFHINNHRKYWMNWNEMIWIDLPSLQSIKLGKYALEGNRDSSCSLKMRSNNVMIRNEWM